MSAWERRCSNLVCSMMKLFVLFAVFAFSQVQAASKRQPCEFGDKIEYGHLGKEVKIGDGLDAYVSHPIGTKSKGGVIIIQDIYGWESSNTRAMVDMLMKNNFTTILPDSFKGKEAWKPGNDWKNAFSFFADRPPKAIGSVVNASIDHVRNKYGIEKFALVGFCWGGQGVHYMMASRRDLVAGVSCYGLMDEDEDNYGDLNNATMFIYGKADHLFKPKTIRGLRRALRERASAKYSIRGYRDQPHAFLHRKLASPDDPHKDQIYAARRKMIQWLNRHLAKA